jgi:hypothetical protein
MIIKSKENCCVSDNFKIVGIDYSISSPSICLYNGIIRDDWDINLCEFHFFSKKVKEISIIDNYGLKFVVYPFIKRTSLSDIEYFMELAAWTIDVVLPIDSYADSSLPQIAMEGYSYSGKGMVFNLAENCGILKSQFFILGLDYTIVSPSEVKKFATGKGNVGKIVMEEQWDKDTGIDLKSILKIHSGMSPLSDIIDSYYICSWFYNYLNNNI